MEKKTKELISVSQKERFRKNPQIKKLLSDRQKDNWKDYEYYVKQKFALTKKWPSCLIKNE